MAKTKVGTAVLEFQVDDKGVVTGLKAVEDHSERSGKRIQSAFTAKAVAIGAAFGTFIGTMAVDAVKALGRQLIEVGSRGIQLAPIVSSFQNLTASINQSGDAMLAVSRTASKGLISDLDLMTAANKAMLLGLPVTAESFGTLTKAAVTLGRAMGQDATKSVNDLVEGLGKGSPEVLNNLGIIVKAEDAYKRYASAVGTSVTSMTAAEKQIAVYNFAMDAAKAKVEEVGGIQLTLKDRITQAKVSIGNFTDALGVAAATSPVINAAFGSVAESLQGAFGVNQTQTIQILMGWVNKIAIAIVEFGQGGVFVAQGLAMGFAALKTVFLGVATVLGAVISGIAEAAARAMEFAAEVPGIGSSFDGAAQAARAFAEKNHESVRSLASMTAEASKGVIGQDAFGATLRGVSSTLGDMKAAMEKAADQQVDSSVIAEHLTKKIDAQGAATEDAAAAAKKLEDAANKERSALSALGIVTERDVNAAIEEFTMLQQRAIKEKVPLETYLRAAIDKLEDLAKKAKAGGQEFGGLTAKIQEARDQLRLLQGAPPVLPASLFASAETGLSNIISGFEAVSVEQLEAGADSRILGAAYETLGIKSRAELLQIAATARQAYADVLASGTATAGELEAARQRVLDAEIAAGGQTVSVWENTIQPAVFGVIDGISGSMAQSFTDMLTGAASFKEGMASIWGSIKQTLLGILDDILRHFVGSFLQGMLKAIAGARIGQAIGGAIASGIGGAAAGGAASGGAGAALTGAGIGIGTIAASVIPPLAIGALIAHNYYGETSPEAEAEKERAEFLEGAAYLGRTPEEHAAELGIDIPTGRPEYRFGTPDLDYASFSRAGTPAMLHGDEAVIPKGSGHALAGEIADALSGRLTSDQPLVVNLHLDREMVGRAVVSTRAAQEQLGRDMATNVFGLGTAVRVATA